MPIAFDGAAMTTLDECPHCGARFKRGRLACPECGSDAETGWASAEEIDYRSIDLPDDAPAPRRERDRPIWLIAAALALVAILLWSLVS